MTQNVLKFSELPEFIRIKLSESGKEEFWHRIDEFGGIKNFCNAFDYSSSTVYNWKNKDSFIPVDLVRNVFGIEAADDVVAMKGKGRSRPINKPEFPLKVNDELLTRVETSVNVNSNGIPVYQSTDKGNLERFEHLLNQIGDTPFEIYNRSVYELRYPKYLHKLLSVIDYNEDLGGLVDEKGVIKKGKIVLEDRKIPVNEFEKSLYSRRKKYKLYVAKGDGDRLRELISEEASRAENVFQ